MYPGCEYDTSIILITLPSREPKSQFQVLMNTSSDWYESIVDVDVRLEEKMPNWERTRQSVLCKAPTLSAFLYLQSPLPEKSRSKGRLLMRHLFQPRFLSVVHSAVLKSSIGISTYSFSRSSSVQILQLFRRSLSTSNSFPLKEHYPR